MRKLKFLVSMSLRCLTWSVISKYLNRVHFCEIVNKAMDSLIFNVYINNLFALSSFDISSKTNELSTYFVDFITHDLQSSLIASLMGNGHSMDATAPATLISPELVRESLIAISQAIPDKIISSKLLPDDTNDVISAQPKDNETADIYRSKLISISYTESPDRKTLASSSPGNLKDSN